MWKSLRNSFQMAGSTGLKAAAEEAAEVVAEGLRQIQMEDEQLHVWVAEGRIGSSLLLLWVRLAVLLLRRRGESFMKRWSLSLDV